MTEILLDRCKIVDLPSFDDLRGRLGVVEGNDTIPFEIRRVYYLYDVPEKSERGAHAHIGLHQLVIAISGEFEIHLNDGSHSRTFHLTDKTHGLYICPMIWRDLGNFSDDGVCLVLASEHFSEDDYIRDYDSFLRMVKT